MKLRNLLLVLFILNTLNLSFTQNIKDSNMLKEKITRFIPVDIKYDASLLSERENQALHKLFEASKLMDTIFLTQVYSRNLEIRNKLQSSNDPYDKLALQYFNLNAGPFDRLDHDKPFWGNKQKPLGANFYPEDMTKEEFNDFITKNPNEKSAFTSEFTVIRRENGKLKAIPYSEFYKQYLAPAASLLKEAADLTENESLKKYLLLRAKAFETNDYFESDMAWMDLKDHKIEVIIGPYEVYEDNLFNYKASFESFVTIVDPVESAKLKTFANYLGDIENHLPIDDQYKNKGRGSESPIMVVNQVFSAGDTKAGVQTLAFNLPNDERVREAKGSKKVMLKNVHEAKFEQLMKPIAEIVLDKEQLPFVTFNAFMSHSLMHEMSHGVGPGLIVVNGEKVDVKKQLKELYSKMEECKADILGMYNNIFMIDKGVFPEEFDKETYITFLAGIFRSVRFGINEAHGGGNAIIYNFLLEKGAYTFNESTQKVKVNFDKIAPALKELANKVLMLQAKGDYDGTKLFIEKYAVNSPTMEILRGKLEHLPVDIRPVFQIEKTNQ